MPTTVALPAPSPLRVEYTVPQVAEYLGRHPATIREYIKAGDLPAHRLNGHEWRILASDLRAFVGQPEPVEEPEPAPEPVQPAASSVSGDPALDEMAEVVARVVKTWPRMTPERRELLSVLVSTP